MATNYILNDKCEKEGFLTFSDTALLSGDEVLSTVCSPINSGISSKSKEEANQLDCWQMLKVEIKLLKEQYLTIVKEKNAIIEEKNRMMDEKMRFIEGKNHMLEEKCRMIDEKESEARNNDESLKQQLEEAMGQNKKLTEERDQMKMEKLIEDRNRFEKELSETKEKLDEQAKLIKEKDDQIKKLKKQQEDETDWRDRRYFDWRDNGMQGKFSDRRF